MNQPSPHAPRRRLALAAAAPLIISLAAALLFLLSFRPGRARLASAPASGPLASAPAYLVGHWSRSGMTPVVASGRLYIPAIDLQVTSAGLVSGKVGGAVLRDARITTWSSADALLYGASFTHRISAQLDGLIDGKPYRAGILIAARAESGYWTARVFLERRELGLGLTGGSIGSPRFAMHPAGSPPLFPPIPPARRSSARSARPAGSRRPPLVVKRLPKITVLTHEFVEVNKPVYYRMRVEGGEIERPTGISGDDGEIWLRLDGVDYLAASHGSFLDSDYPMMVTEFADGSLPDEAGGPLRLTPGRHRLALVCRPDEAVRNTLFFASPVDEIVSDEVEFTVVPALPPGYPKQVSQPAWDQLLRERLADVIFSAGYSLDDPQGMRERVYLNFNFRETLPFDIAADVFVESERDPGRRIYACELTQLRTGGIPPSYSLSLSAISAPGLDAMDLERGRWRVILVPSRKAALADPGVRDWYGREFVSDWGVLRAADSWVESRLISIGAMDPARTHGERDSDHRATPEPLPLDFDDILRHIRGASGTYWPLEPGIDMERMATRAGGGARVHPESGARLLPLPDAESPVDATLKARARRAELKASAAGRLLPAPGRTVHAAVLTDRGALFVLQIDATASLQERWWWWCAEDGRKP